MNKGCDPRSDPAFRRPVIDLDQWRERFLPDGARIRYRCIQGGFAGTGVRFSMLFPEKDSCSRRFHQCLTPAPSPPSPTGWSGASTHPERRCGKNHHIGFPIVYVGFLKDFSA